MKRQLLIPALMSLMAVGATAQDNVLDRLEINTSTYSYEGYNFYIADIDSITFGRGTFSFGVPGEVYKLMTVHGNGFNKRRPAFPIDSISGLELKFRDSRKLYAPKFSDFVSEKNSISIKCEPSPGAKGYEVRYICYKGITNRDFSILLGDDFDSHIAGKPAYFGGTIKVDSPELIVKGLEYSWTYYFSVRAISEAGEEFNSDWSLRYGIANTMPLTMTTYNRGSVPAVISVSDRTYDSFRVNFNLDYANHSSKDPYTNFEVADGKFVAHELRVTPQSEDATLDPKWLKYRLTAQDLERGYVIVSGLTSGSGYTVDIINTNIDSEPDARYNTIVTHTKAESTPILVPHRVDDVATAGCRLTGYINSYMSNNVYDDQVFYLEGNKVYYIDENVSVFKGFTLETDPADVAVGKRAVVYMSGPDSLAHNFMLGKNDSFETFDITPLTFRNIDFDVPAAQNYGDKGTAGTGNYFFNCYSNSPGFTLEALNIENCSFRRFIRSFVRIQGSSAKVFKKVNCDGNLFYDCGYYDNNGRGYAWFTTAGTPNTNLYADFRFTNNTIYDSPRTCLINDNDRNLEWAADVKWNITIENNTFINFSTRTSGRNIIQMRFIPVGSHFSIQRNLFSLVKSSASDARQLYSCGADVRTFDPNITFEIKDNYSTGCESKHLVDDGIFTSAAFSAAKNSFGASAFSASNKGTADDLKVKVGSTPLMTTDLFVSPNPPYNQVSGQNSGNDHKAPDNILEALKYQHTPTVLNHEIYTKNIGDPRWR